jgi:hypothetical protein
MYFGGSQGYAVRPRRDRAERDRDTLGYSLQISTRPGWLRPPRHAGDTGATVIRHNVFDKRRNGATGPSARPNAGGTLAAKRTGPATSTIYGTSSTTPDRRLLLQAEGRLGIYNNPFLNRHGDAGDPAAP